MCGIFGVIGNHSSTFESKELIHLLGTVAKYSEARGKDSSGIAVKYYNKKQINVLKGPIRITDLLQRDEYNRLFESCNGAYKSNPFSAIGHARLTTNGTQLKDINNQPVVKNDSVLIHNGIIVNVDELWLNNPDIAREYDIDTEVFAALVRKNIASGIPLSESIKKAISDCFGTISSAMLFADSNQIALATNNGSLYYARIGEDALVFASESFILQQTAEKLSGRFSFNPDAICQLKANTMLLIDPTVLSVQLTRMNDEEDHTIVFNKTAGDSIAISSVGDPNTQLNVLADMASIAISPAASQERKLLEFNIDKISNLKRCVKCLLPETFPFLSFDEHGVCTICNNYKKQNQPKPISLLKSLVEPYRSKDGKPDCIVPFSGGRDSTYVLHLVKKELGLNPIAFTYDWGMVTDLGRRNIARVTGRLGVENIIVSANIHWKRENISKNITAWLKNPQLGMIPLFMAGDKYFFYYTNLIKKQTGVSLNIWGINPLENTDFKVGFSGIPLRFDKKRIYSLKLVDQLRLFKFVGKNILGSPGYLNQSVFDTLGSFAVRYIAPKKDYYHMFDYYRWDEKEIEDLIINEYEWETSIDTKTTWRIGDGTAGFYNYIYYTVAGFSEYDTFRSNQIREGMLTREEGLKLINQENKPRYESIKWYMEILGLDFNNVISRINQIPKLY